MEVALSRMAGHIVEDVSEGFALEIGTIGIADEVEVHLRLFKENLLNARLLAAHT
jgi:hypothetical protein